MYHCKVLSEQTTPSLADLYDFLHCSHIVSTKLEAKYAKSNQSREDDQCGSRISLTIPGGAKLFNAQFYPKNAKNKELSAFLLIGGMLLVLPWIRQCIDETLD